MPKKNGWEISHSEEKAIRIMSPGASQRSSLCEMKLKANHERGSSRKVQCLGHGLETAGNHADLDVEIILDADRGVLAGYGAAFVQHPVALAGQQQGNLGIVIDDRVVHGFVQVAANRENLAIRVGNRTQPAFRFLDGRFVFPVQAVTLARFPLRES